MQISDLEKRSAVSAKTIRYYEEIDLLPSPKRRANGYRDYQTADVERLQLVSGARRLDFSLDEIRELLDLRDRNIAPCGTLLDMLERKAGEIKQRIAELKQLEEDLKALRVRGESFPLDDVEGKNCVCHLVSAHEGSANGL